MSHLLGRLGMAWAWLAAGLAPLGCMPQAKKAAAPRLNVLATLDALKYQPGEAVVCTVTLTNDGDAPAQAGSLCTDTVEFWFGPTGTDLRYRRDAVRSSREKGFSPVTIAPGDNVSRRFVLTRVTEEEGEFAFYALYSAGGNTPGHAGITGPAFIYRVDGRPLFRRDAHGLIRKEDALEAVKHKVGSEVANAEARLVRNEAGLLDWFVCGEVNGGGEASKRAFFVNPYTGVIRAEARPDMAAQTADAENTEASQ